MSGKSTSETAALKSQLRISQDRQTASAEILRTIGSVSGDAERSLFEIAEITKRLFAASSVSIFVAEGDKWGQVIHDGASSERISAEVPVDQLRIGSHSLPGAAFSENRQIHVPDIDNIDPAIADWPGVRPARAAGSRTISGTPLRRAGGAVGVLIVHRNRLVPFTADELNLLQSFADQAAIAIHNARLFNETQEALERQTATADILKVIASSPDDVQPVFEAIVTNAVRLVGAFSAGVYRFVDGMVHLAAFTSTNPGGDQALRDSFPRPISGTEQFRRAYAGEVAAITDTEDQPDRQLTELARARGFRSLMHAPLISKGKSIGTIVVSRRNPGPFSAHHVQLLQTFADQAVIAIENVRLFNETWEALEQQTATAEVLGVINSSPGDLAPVFDAMLERAIRLCDAVSGHFRTYDGNGFSLAAVKGEVKHIEAMRQSGPLVPGPHHPVSRFLRGDNLIHLPNTRESEEYRADARFRSLVDLGVLSLLSVALRKDGVLLGYINVYRHVAEPFTERQIALLQNFASQAVIAMENARLLSELRARTDDLAESLQQQTATADVLKVISRSAFDLQPVLETLVASAAQLCGADAGIIWLRKDDLFHAAAASGFSPQEMAFFRDNPRSIHDKSLAPRVLRSRRTVHIPDRSLDPEFAFPGTSSLPSTMLGVPLLRDDRIEGVFTLARSNVAPFRPRQIELVESFADQAVIAIENARLFNETQEALERETSSADILRVISSSPTDVQPVFDAIVASLLRLFGTEFAVVQLLRDGSVTMPAVGGKPGFERLAERFPRPLDDTTIGGMVMMSRQTRQFLAQEDLAAPSGTRDFARDFGFNSVLFTPMIHEGQVIGCVGTADSDARVFDPRQVALIETFARQAVIAIENTRLFNETKEALERQTATADILKVIASSPSDVQPVLEAVADRAMSLLDAWSVLVTRFDGELLRFGAARGALPDTEQFLRNDFPMRPEAAAFAGRCVLERSAINIPDALADSNPQYRERARLRGFRAALSVPMLRDGQPIGVITVSRKEAGAFAANEVELLQTFSDQAVIAIENVRLFNETREALERQTATADILKVIASSPDDVQPVFKAIAASANALLGGFSTAVFRFVDDIAHLAAFTPTTPTADSILQSSFPMPLADFEQFELAKTGQPVEVADIEQMPNRRIKEIARARGFRSMLFVPLMSGEAPIGLISVTRTETGSFAGHHVQLLRTFADQAVIAISNVQLFQQVQAKTADLQESLQQQTATADVLKVISRSAFDLDSVLSTLLASAATLCEAEKGVIFLREDNQFKMVSNHGFSAEFEAFARAHPYPAENGSTTTRSAASGAAVHVVDVLADETQSDLARQYQRLGGHRTIIGVPLRRDGETIGVFTLTRQVVRAFTHRQIELVETFADQAVIAIQNVRLFEQVQARTRDLSKSLDDLRTAQDRLVQTEKLASLGQLTAGIAHEIKNPLNFVNNFSALSAELTDELNDALKPVALDNEVRKEVDELTAMLKDNLEKVVQHGKRADSIVKNMLLHSREGSGERRPADINTLLDESLNLAYHGARAEKSAFNITLQRDFDADAGEAELFPQEITRAFLNFIANGFYAATRRKAENGDPAFEPLLGASTRNLGDSVEIRIRDNGTGIPAEVREKMFNPFFTTKPAGEGTGLGLSMSHDIIVKQHGGSIDVETEPGQFTELRIVLPRGGRK